MNNIIEQAVNEAKQLERHDPVNHPLHYAEGAIECIDCIEAAIDGLSGEYAFLTGQVMKYTWRWSKKNGVEDLKKAEWYLRRLIAKAEKAEAIA